MKRGLLMLYAWGFIGIASGLAVSHFMFWSGIGLIAHGGRKLHAYIAQAVSRG
jgi:hypothetical protein